VKISPGIHGHCACPPENWFVFARRCNHSAFNGYHMTLSDYSGIQCHRCLHVWRSKAKYVDGLPDGPLTNQKEDTQ
jgi:hypothetical protein